MKIFLIGYRASGKTTVGKLLAQKLGLPFADTDLLSEKKAVMTIKDFVAARGWEAFRRLEAETVASLCNAPPAVVATGGGVVMAGENLLLLKSMGPLVYLQTPLADLLARLKRDASGPQVRPPFTAEDLDVQTKAVLARRLPVYEAAADFTVDTNGKSVVRVADEIYGRLLEAGIVAGMAKTKKRKNSI